MHHAYLLGLQLMVSTRRGPEVMGKWMYRLFRRQHQEKFLSSFEKLGLNTLPHAIACAQYHVLSNNMGGVDVEYMEENARKAWVRFRYPRWMYHGATLCGIPLEVSRGFLEGWYAHNGLTLKNPHLGFVCVSEDMTGEFGLCGYFREFDHELAPEERLQFAKEELPPPFDATQQPSPPANQWNTVRLAKARRNYALEYIRNGLCELAGVIGEDETRQLGGLSARLIGLQYFQETAAMVNARDGDLNDAAAYLTRMFIGMGDTATCMPGKTEVQIEQQGLRVLRGLAVDERNLVLGCWAELWVGTMRAQRQLKTLTWEAADDQVTWRSAALTDRARLA